MRDQAKFAWVEALKVAVALSHFAQNSYLVVHATLGDGDEFTIISLKAILAEDFQSASELWDDYANAFAKESDRAD